ncbi:MAG: CvpA family protein [Clostridia bacterium]|nr:CvpA family protein [Clostridia bacterium]
MNIVDIVILAILAYGLLAGMYKGMLTSALKLLAFAGAWFGSLAVYPNIARLALSNQTLLAVLNQYLEPGKANTCFTNPDVVGMSVSQVVAGAESSIRSVVDSVKPNFEFIKQAFSDNIRNLAFRDSLQIDSVLDYFTQTLWTAVFNVIAFLLAFIVLYCLLSLLVNLLDRVVDFPVMRHGDSLIGGLFGVLRATVVVVIVLTLMPIVTNIINPELTEQLKKGSSLYSVFSQFDLLNVRNQIAALIHPVYR